MQRVHSELNSEQFKALAFTSNEVPILGTGQNRKTLLDSVKHLKPVRIKLHEVFLTCLCRSLSKHKGNKATHQFVKFHKAQLDIRSIISNSIGLKDFLRCHLSEP